MEGKFMTIRLPSVYIRNSVLYYRCMKNLHVGRFRVSEFAAAVVLTSLECR